MKKALVVHPQFKVGGGAELVSVKIIEWLISQKNYSVAILTLSGSTVFELTDLGLPDDLISKVAVLQARCPSVIRNAGGRYELLKLAYLHRAARSICRSYDLCISTYNEIDFGTKGFQYIHHPSFARRDILERYKIVGKESIIDRIKLIQKAYYALLRRVSMDDIKGYMRNVTAVNSEFMKMVVKMAYSLDAYVVYPGFLPDDEFQGTPWENREFGFVSVGRIGHDKAYDQLIKAFTRLGIAFPGAKFVVVGRVENERIKKDIEKQVSMLGLNVKTVYNADRDTLIDILSRNKFYIHARQYEHFGISALEAAYYGCIPIVHNSGGVIEIVRTDLLRYSDFNDLVNKVRILVNEHKVRAEVLQSIKDDIRRFKEKEFYLSLEKIFRENQLLID